MQIVAIHASLTDTGSSFNDRYTLGTVLSFYNKMLVGKDSRIFNNEAFPGRTHKHDLTIHGDLSDVSLACLLAAPLFMAGVQFALQHMIARLVFATGLVKRDAQPLSWQDWLRSGEVPSPSLAHIRIA